MELRFILPALVLVILFAPLTIADQQSAETVQYPDDSKFLEKMKFSWSHTFDILAGEIMMTTATENWDNIPYILNYGSSIFSDYEEMNDYTLSEDMQKVKTAYQLSASEVVSALQKIEGMDQTDANYKNEMNKVATLCVMMDYWLNEYITIYHMNTGEPVEIGRPEDYSSYIFESFEA